jgi:hypothetical protein
LNSKNSHYVPAKKADTDHGQPTGNHGEVVDNVAKGNVQATLGQETVVGVKPAFVALLLLPGLLSMDVVDGLRGDGGEVQVLDVERNCGTFLAGVDLGKVEMPDGGGCGGPDRAEDCLLFAVYVSEVRCGWVCGEECDGVLVIKRLVLSFRAASKAPLE